MRVQRPQELEESWGVYLFPAESKAESHEKATTAASVLASFPRGEGRLRPRVPPGRSASLCPCALWKASESKQRARWDTGERDVRTSRDWQRVEPNHSAAAVWPYVCEITASAKAASRVRTRRQESEGELEIDLQRCGAARVGSFVQRENYRMCNLLSLHRWNTAREFLEDCPTFVDEYVFSIGR